MVPIASPGIPTRPTTVRPVVHAVLFLALGIALHRTVPRAPAVWLLASIALAGSAGLLLKHAGGSLLALSLALTTVGITAAQIDWFYYPRQHVGMFAGTDPRLAQVEVEVDDAPHLTFDAHRKHIPPRMSFPATIRRIKSWDGWIDACGSIQVSVSESVNGLAAGQKLTLTGLLQRPLAAMNPGQFDWANYYRTQRVLAELRVGHGYDVRIIGQGRSWPLPGIRRSAAALLSRGIAPDREVDGALLTALVLGQRGPALRDVQENFRHTGTSHLLASSGLRVGIFAACLYVLCQILCLRPRMSLGLVTLSVIALGLLMWPTPQAIRPVLLSAALGFALLGRRGVDSLQILALAAISILIFHPLDLYGAGFQLSFITVAGMILFTPLLTKFLDSFESPHRRAARGLPQRGIWDRYRDRMSVWFRGVLAAAVVAWAVSLPLVAWHFEQLNPWAVPIGILLSPLVMASLIGGFFKVILTASIPSGAGVWAFVALAPVDCLRHAIGWMAKLPLADVPISAPPMSVIITYYALLCWPAFLQNSAVAALISRISLKFANTPSAQQTAARVGLWSGRLAPLAGCILVFWLPFRGALSRPGDAAVRLTLLSVGAGQCAVVEIPSGRAILLDDGSSTLSDTLHDCLAPFLRHEGRSRIDSIYLSHGDYDHISAAEETVVEYDVRAVLTSPYFRRHAQESGTAKGLLNFLDHHGPAPRLIQRGDRIDLGNGAAIDVLWPPADSRLNSNNTGLVLRLTYANRSILFPADIQEPPERELLRNPGKLRSDVLVAPHHGSSESSTGDFVAAVAPRFILSSNSSRLSTKQRIFEEVVRGRMLYRTPRCGAITVDIKPDGAIQVVCFSAHHRLGGPTNSTFEGDEPVN